MTKTLKLNDLPFSEKWYALTEENGEAVLRIDGVIGGDWYGDGTSAKDFAAELAAVTAPRLVVHVNSPGGSVRDGLAIYNLLAAWGRVEGRQLEAVVDGVAASVASVIVCAAPRIVMPENAFLMVHHPWMEAVGNAGELRALADELDKIGEQIVGIYAARSGKTGEYWRELMTGADGADGTFLTASEAFEAGLCEEVIENVAAAACVGVEIYPGAPGAVAKFAAAVGKRDREKALRDAGFSRREAAKIAAETTPRDAGKTGTDSENSVDWQWVVNELRKEQAK